MVQNMAQLMNDNGVDEFRWLVRQQKRKVQAVFSEQLPQRFRAEVI